MDWNQLPVKLPPDVAQWWKKLLLGGRTSAALRGDLVAKMENDPEKDPDNKKANKRLVSPLSRVVNGHGAEIAAWFQPGDARGEALAGVLERSSSDLLDLLTSELAPGAPRAVVDGDSLAFWPLRLRWMPVVDGEGRLALDLERSAATSLRSLAEPGDTLGGLDARSQAELLAELGQLEEALGAIGRSVGLKLSGAELSCSLLRETVRRAKLTQVKVDDRSSVTVHILVDEVQPGDVPEWVQHLRRASGAGEATFGLLEALSEAECRALLRLPSLQEGLTWVRLVNDVAARHIRSLRPRDVLARSSEWVLGDPGDSLLRAARAVRKDWGQWLSITGCWSAPLSKKDRRGLLAREGAEPADLRRALAQLMRAVERGGADAAKEAWASVAPELLDEPFDLLIASGWISERDDGSWVLEEPLQDHARQAVALCAPPMLAGALSLHPEGVRIVEQAVAIAPVDELGAWVERALAVEGLAQPHVAVAVLSGLVARADRSEPEGLVELWASSLWMTAMGYHADATARIGGFDPENRALQEASRKFASALPLLDRCAPHQALAALVRPSLLAACDRFRPVAREELGVPLPEASKRREVASERVGAAVSAESFVTLLCDLAPHQLPFQVHRDWRASHSLKFDQELLAWHARAGDADARRAILRDEVAWPGCPPPWLGRFGTEAVAWVVSETSLSEDVQQQTLAALLSSSTGELDWLDAWVPHLLERSDLVTDEELVWAGYTAAFSDLRPSRVDRLARSASGARSPRPLVRALSSRLPVEDVVALAARLERDDVLAAWAQPPLDVITSGVEGASLRRSEPQSTRVPGREDGRWSVRFDALRALARVRHLALLGLCQRGTWMELVRSSQERWVVDHPTIRSERRAARALEQLDRESSSAMLVGGTERLPVTPDDWATLRSALRGAAGLEEGERAIWVARRWATGGLVGGSQSDPGASEAAKWWAAMGLLSDNVQPAISQLRPFLEQLWLCRRTPEVAAVFEKLAPRVNSQWREGSNGPQERHRALLLRKDGPTVDGFLFKRKVRGGAHPEMRDGVVRSLAEDLELAGAAWARLPDEAKAQVLRMMSSESVEDVWFDRAERHLTPEEQFLVCERTGNVGQRRRAARRLVRGAEDVRGRLLARCAVPRAILPLDSEAQGDVLGGIRSLIEDGPADVTVIERLCGIFWRVDEGWTSGLDGAQVFACGEPFVALVARLVADGGLDAVAGSSLLRPMLRFIAHTAGEEAVESVVQPLVNVGLERSVLLGRLGLGSPAETRVGEALERWRGMVAEGGEDRSVWTLGYDLRSPADRLSFLELAGKDLEQPKLPVQNVALAVVACDLEDPTSAVEWLQKVLQNVDRMDRAGREKARWWLFEVGRYRAGGEVGAWLRRELQGR